jgi:hypothetical protein
MAKTIESIEKIERLEAVEEQFSIRLEGLSASSTVDSFSYISISGDVFATNGTTIGQNIELVISGHDAADRVLISRKHSIDAKSFLGIDTFSVLIGYPLLSFVGVKKVRIYPKLAK